jgi:hypothetical protein
LITKTPALAEEITCRKYTHKWKHILHHDDQRQKLPSSTLLCGILLHDYRFWNQLKTCIQQLKEAHPILSCRLQILHGTLLGFTFSYMQKTGVTPQLKLSQHSQPSCLQKVVVLWKAKTLESSCVASLGYSALFT